MTSRISSWAYDHLIRQELRLIIEGKCEDIEPYFSIVESFFDKVIPDGQEKKDHADARGIRMMWRFVTRVLPCLVTDNITDEKKGQAVKEGIQFLDEALKSIIATGDKDAEAVRLSLTKLKCEMVKLAIIALVKEKGESRILFDRYGSSLSKVHQDSMLCVLQRILDPKKILKTQSTYLEMIRDTLQKVMNYSDAAFICKVSNACKQYRHYDERYLAMVDTLDSDIEVIDTLGEQPASVGDRTSDSSNSKTARKEQNTPSPVRAEHSYLAAEKPASPDIISDSLPSSSLRGGLALSSNDPILPSNFWKIPQDGRHVPSSSKDNSRLSTLQSIMADEGFKVPYIESHRFHSKRPSDSASGLISLRRQVPSICSKTSYSFRTKNSFTPAQDANIIMGVQKFFSASHKWKKILAHYNFPEYRTAGHLKDRWRTLVANGEVEIVSGEIKLSSKYRSLVAFLSSSKNHENGKKQHHHELERHTASDDKILAKGEKFESLMNWINTGKKTSNEIVASVLQKKVTKSRESNTSISNNSSCQLSPRLKGKSEEECQSEKKKNFCDEDDDDNVIAHVSLPNRESTKRKNPFRKNPLGKYVRATTINKEFVCPKAQNPKQAENEIEIEPSDPSKQSVVSSKKPGSSDKTVDTQSQSQNLESECHNSPETLQCPEAMRGMEQTDGSRLSDACTQCNGATVSNKKLQVKNGELEDLNTPSTLQLMEVLCGQEQSASEVKQGISEGNHNSSSAEQVMPHDFHTTAGSSQSTPDILLHAHAGLVKSLNAAHKDTGNAQCSSLATAKPAQQMILENVSQPVASASSETDDGKSKLSCSKTIMLSVGENSQFTLNLLQNLEEESQLETQAEPSDQSLVTKAQVVDSLGSAGLDSNENVIQETDCVKNGTAAEKLLPSQFPVSLDAEDERIASPILDVMSSCSSNFSVRGLANPASPTTSEYMTPDEGMAEEMPLTQTQDEPDDENERTLVPDTTVVIEDAEVPNNIEQWTENNQPDASPQGSESRASTPIDADDSEKKSLGQEPHDTDSRETSLTSLRVVSRLRLGSDVESSGILNSNERDVTLTRQIKTESPPDDSFMLAPPPDDMDVKDLCPSNLDRFPVLRLTRIKIEPGLYTTVPCFCENDSSEDIVSLVSDDNASTHSADKADGVVSNAVCSRITKQTSCTEGPSNLEADNNDGQVCNSVALSVAAHSTATMGESRLVGNVHMASKEEGADSSPRATRSRSRPKNQSRNFASSDSNLGVKRQLPVSSDVLHSDAAAGPQDATLPTGKKARFTFKKKRFNLLSGGELVKMSEEDKAFFFSDHGT